MHHLDNDTGVEAIPAPLSAVGFAVKSFWFHVTIAVNGNLICWLFLNFSTCLQYAAYQRCVNTSSGSTYLCMQIQRGPWINLTIMTLPRQFSTTMADLSVACILRGSRAQLTRWWGIGKRRTFLPFRRRVDTSDFYQRHTNASTGYKDPGDPQVTNSGQMKNK